MKSLSSTGHPLQDLRHFGADLFELSPTRETSVPASDSISTPTLSQAQAYCRSLASRHYENFTVASWFLPRELRTHFYSIYAYCRWADDLADEAGPAGSSLLTQWQTQLERSYTDAPLKNPAFIALRETVRLFAIPSKPFTDLLSAFQQDQTTTRYATRAELLDYCARSANPVGRLILYLARTTDEKSLRQSDAICTGLQLANFWQDVSNDWHKRRRIYLPAEDLQRFPGSEAAIQSGHATPEFRELLLSEVAWAESFFQAGQPLCSRVPPSFRRQIRLFHDGGMAILAAIRRQHGDVLRRRPKLTAWQKLRLMLSVLTLSGNRP